MLGVGSGIGSGGLANSSLMSGVVGGGSAGGSAGGGGGGGFGASGLFGLGSNTSSSGGSGPTVECLLQGSVSDDAVDKLLARLEGLCGAQSTLLPAHTLYHPASRPNTFHIHEMVYSQKGNLSLANPSSSSSSSALPASTSALGSSVPGVSAGGAGGASFAHTPTGAAPTAPATPTSSATAPAAATPGSAPSSSPSHDMTLRVRHYVDLDKWQLCWSGQPEFSDTKRSTIVRATLMLDVSGASVCQLLEAMGFALDFEFLKTGNVYSHVSSQKRVKVDVYVARVQRLLQRRDVRSAVPLAAASDGFLVEMCALGTQDKIPDLEEAVHAFAEKLVPLTVLSKIDHRVVYQHTLPPMPAAAFGRATPQSGFASPTAGATPMRL